MQYDGNFEKKTPLGVEKSKRPRCFKRVKDFPVNYAHSYNAWMASNIFKEFLLKWDKELKDEKIVLLLDNCSEYPAEEELHLKNIKLVFLPPNTTSIIQPLDQGIIRSFKFHYRKTIVQQIIKDIDSHNSSDSLTANKLSKSLSILGFHAYYSQRMRHCFVQNNIKLLQKSVD
ncbi:hypothetical protein AVEN_124238-1 [Araneus ventricosus]|uniref:DDE-1 domain-containing protein n=1 Tax=Araneus ventricosus TaxID=182803 RepID=A0A4Y2M1F3_ARAVE|nr:hypothetical protein AVEN_124238-1 [Araneus ventricosus]